MENIEREIVEEIKRMSGIDVEMLMKMGLLKKKEAIKWIVKKKYFEMYGKGKNYTDVKYELSDIYGMSISSIEKMIYRKI